MSTIREVAKLAGVSTGTVSHVLTGATAVAGHLRSRVLAAVDTLNYSPNRNAQNLRTRRLRVLGLAVSEAIIASRPRLITAACDCARRRGYSMVLVSTTKE